MQEAVIQARAALPSWVPWGAFAVAMLLAFSASTLGTWVLLSFVAKPLRACGDVPWYERARLLYPLRNATLFAIVFWTTLTFFLGYTYLYGPVTRPSQGVFSGICSLWGFMGALWMGHRFERTYGGWEMNFRSSVKSRIAHLLFVFPHVLFILGMLLFLPTEMTTRFWLVASMGFVVFLFFLFGGGLVLGRILGWVRPAPDDLRESVGEVCQSGEAKPFVWVLDLLQANAFAWIWGQGLGFTKPLLNLLSREEIQAIARHEMAHLKEGRSVRWMRACFVSSLFALGFGRVFHAHWGLWGLLGMLGFVFLVLLWGSRFGKHLEVQADLCAHGDEAQRKVYARTLEKMYAHNLMPAVLGREVRSHPDLYDRMLSAGLTPEYERPAPPSDFRFGILKFMLTFLFCATLVATASISMENLKPNRKEVASMNQRLAWMSLYGGDETVVSGLAWEFFRLGRRETSLPFFKLAAKMADHPFYTIDLVRVLINMGDCEEVQRVEARAMGRFEAQRGDAYISEGLEKVRHAAQACKFD